MIRQLPTIISTLLLVTACSYKPFMRQQSSASQLSAYRQSFHDAIGQTLVGTVDRQKLLGQIEQQRTLWLGDHHRHSRLHALQTELLTQIQSRGIPMAFGLECIGVHDEQDVNDFLANKIDLDTLCKRIRTRWTGSWLDDRDLDPWFYRSLLEFAKRHRIAVFALEPTPRLPLPIRDSYIAQTVKKACELHNDKLVVIIVGQTHLVGDGDITRRSGQPGTMIGGLPPHHLLELAPRKQTRGDLWQDDSKMLWFNEMF